MIEGKIEAGLIRKDGTYLIMPNRKKISISALYGETEEEIEGAKAGDQVRIRIRGIEEEDLSAGFVLCLPTRPCVSIYPSAYPRFKCTNILPHSMSSGLSKLKLSY
jgi:peptide chain release factor subunit 3